jgi:hypothetical protein
VDFYLPEVVEVSDYFPFGWQLPGRNWRSGDRYRYAFQGQEGDDAWSGVSLRDFNTKSTPDPTFGSPVRTIEFIHGTTGKSIIFKFNE